MMRARRKNGKMWALPLKSPRDRRREHVERQDVKTAQQLVADIEEAGTAHPDETNEYVVSLSLKGTPCCRRSVACGKRG